MRWTTDARRFDLTTSDAFSFREVQASAGRVFRSALATSAGRCAALWTRCAALSRPALLIVLLATSACGPPAPAPEPELLRSFVAGRDRPLSPEVVSVEGDAWRVVPGEARSVKLFEIADPGVESARLIYRAEIDMRQVHELHGSMLQIGHTQHNPAAAGAAI